MTSIFSWVLPNGKCQMGYKDLIRMFLPNESSKSRQQLCSSNSTTQGARYIQVTGSKWEKLFCRKPEEKVQFFQVQMTQHGAAQHKRLMIGILNSLQATHGNDRGQDEDCNWP
ncbi:hypothetical protein NQZ68_001112 [Dissostichus eleginoides]|nr:hypothetical protein NQZ68_001112 [Dissostichus eleginoides]